jgi:hypothetical protein
MQRTLWQAGSLMLLLALGVGGVARAETRKVATASGTTTVSAELRVNPRLPTTRDPVTLSSVLRRACPVDFHPPQVQGHSILIAATDSNPIPCPSGFPQTFRDAATLSPLPAGSYTVSLTVNGEVLASQAIAVAEPAATLPLLGRFSASLTFQGSGGTTTAYAVPLTTQSGYFWFFGSDNIEVTVKAIDGRLLNGHFWIFIASMTDVPFTLSILDLSNPGCGPLSTVGQACVQKVYTSPAGKNTNFIDVQAF